jgi:hypothetical protein
LPVNNFFAEPLNKFSPTRLLRLTDLQLAANVPYCTLRELVRSGYLTPDFVAGRFVLFRPEREEEIVDLVTALRSRHPQQRTRVLS